MDSTEIVSAINFDMVGTTNNTPSAYGGLYEINGFNVDALGINSGNRMLDSLELSNVDGVSTSAVFRVHIYRIILVLVLFVYGVTSRIFHSVNNYCSSLHNIVYFEYFQANWLNLYLVPYRSLFRFIYLEFAGYKIDRVVEESSRMKQSFLPQSIGLVLHQNNFNLDGPPSIPQPYLGNNKKIVVPSQREIQVSIGLRNDYFTKLSIHNASEEIRILTELTRFILWVGLLAKCNENGRKSVEFVTIFESRGSIWKEKDSLERLRDSILMELNSSNLSCNGGCTFPSLFIIDSFSKKTILVSGNNSRSIVEEEQNLETNAPTTAETISMEDVDRNSRIHPFNPSDEPSLLTIYLVDDRLKNISVNELDILPPNPKLLMISDNKWRHRVFGYLPRISDSSIEIYSSKYRFSFNFS